MLVYQRVHNHNFPHQNCHNWGVNPISRPKNRTGPASESIPVKSRFSSWPGGPTSSRIHILRCPQSWRCCSRPGSSTPALSTCSTLGATPPCGKHPTTCEIIHHRTFLDFLLEHKRCLQQPNEQPKR
jgi:hypothetical protein